MYGPVGHPSGVWRKAKVSSRFALMPGAIRVRAPVYRADALAKKLGIQTLLRMVAKSSSHRLRNAAMFDSPVKTDKRSGFNRGFCGYLTPLQKATNVVLVSFPWFVRGEANDSPPSTGSHPWQVQNLLEVLTPQWRVQIAQGWREVANTQAVG